MRDKKLFRPKDLKYEYDVADVLYGVNYWFNKLLNIMLQIFEYEGLPSSIPKRELEIPLLLDGYVGVFNNKKYGLVASRIEPYGQDKYYNPIAYTYAQPELGGGNIKIGIEGVIIYNSELQHNAYEFDTDGGAYTFLKRYARMLADIESTISNYMVDIRDTEYAVAKNDAIKQSLEAYFLNKQAGKRTVITDDLIMSAFESIQRPQRSSADRINDLLIAKDKILEQFFRDIGVKFYNPKKAQVTEDEIEADTQLLVISTDDMLEERKAGVERINDLFGTSITVKLNEKFDAEKYKGGMADGQNKNAAYNIGYNGEGSGTGSDQ
jgi:hypothetical protein